MPSWTGANGSRCSSRWGEWSITTPPSARVSPSTSRNIAPKWPRFTSSRVHASFPWGCRWRTWPSGSSPSTPTSRVSRRPSTRSPKKRAPSVSRAASCRIRDRRLGARRICYGLAMSEITLDLRGMEKSRAYPELDGHVRAVLEGIDDSVTAMATVSCLVHHAFGHLWTGFYRVVGPRLLRVGPYQGTLGCLEIPFGTGVCGTAAAERRTVVVPDVEKFPGHITCDGRSRSEIVVPVT